MSCGHDPNIRMSCCEQTQGYGFRTCDVCKRQTQATVRCQGCGGAFVASVIKYATEDIIADRDRYKAALIEISKLSNGRGPDCAVYLDQIGCVITAALTPAKEGER